MVDDGTFHLTPSVRIGPSGEFATVDEAVNWLVAEYRPQGWMGEDYVAVLRARGHAWERAAS